MDNHEKATQQVAQPLWVQLAFSAIPSRKGALALIGASLLFTLYCIPFSQFVPEGHWVTSVFLIDDWSWIAMMIPISIWYWLCLRWMDRHRAWES